MTRWLKTIGVIIVAAAITAGSWFIEQRWALQAQQLEYAIAIDDGAPTIQGTAEVEREDNSITVEQSLVLDLGDVVQATQQPAVIIFHGSVLRLAPGARVKILANSTQGYLLDVMEGRVWLQNRLAKSKLILKADNVLLIPRKTVADISVSADDVLIRVLRSDVTVGLLPDGYKPQDLPASRSSDFINSFLIAQGAQARINFNQIRQNDDTIGKLLSSKLMKEFQYGILNNAVLANDDWILMNLKADDGLTKEVLKTLKSNIESRPLHYSSLTSTAYQFQQLSSDVFDTLTFVENKRKERYRHDIMAYFLDAEYLILFNRAREADEYLKIFQEEVRRAFSEADAEEKQLWQAMLRSKMQELEFITPEDPLFTAKIGITNVFFDTLGNDENAFWEKLGIVRDFLDDAYSLAPESFAEARVSLQQYYDRFTLFLKQQPQEFGKYQYVMTEENQRMDQLLRLTAEFYRDNYFQMKHFLEAEWLKLLSEGTDKNEERQTIMSSKVDFLQQLQTYFLDQKIGLGDARLVALRLINEMRDLQTSGGLGIDELFALRLKDYGVFLRFLNASNTAILKGSSPREKYNDFLATQNEQVDIEKAINEFLGQEAESVITTSQILDKVKADFAAINVQQLELAPLESTEDRFVTVQRGVLGEVEFSALYDWDRKLISQVKVGETTVLIAPTRLANLPVLLKPKPTPSVSPSTPTTPAPSANTTSASKSEKVAKILLIQKLKNASIAVKEVDITIVDLSNGLYAVKNAQIIAQNGTVSSEPLLSFNFDNKTNQISNLAITRDGTTELMQQNYSLESLTSVE